MVRADRGPRALSSACAGVAPALFAFAARYLRGLLLHTWTRNVRQLELRLVSALQIAGGAPISIEHLALESPSAPARPRRRWMGPDLERRNPLIGLLARNRGNISAAARELGKPRSQLQRWMKKYAIDPRGELPED